MGRTSAGEGVSVVNHQRQSVLMRDGGKLFDVHDIELGIAQRLGIDCAGLVIDRRAHAIEVIGIHEISQ